MPKLDETIAGWVEDTLEEEITAEEHYDCDTHVTYIKGDTRTRILARSHIILYTSGGVEHVLCTFAMDHPDEGIVRSSVQEAMDCLRGMGYLGRTMRDVEDIYEAMDEDDDDN